MGKVRVQGYIIGLSVSQAHDRLFLGNTLIGALERGETKNQCVCAVSTTAAENSSEYEGMDEKGQNRKGQKVPRKNRTLIDWPSLGLRVTAPPLFYSRPTQPM